MTTYNLTVAAGSLAVTTLPSLDAGITAAMQASNTALLATILDPDHEGQTLPNPAIVANESAYLSGVFHGYALADIPNALTSAARSWAKYYLGTADADLPDDPLAPAVDATPTPPPTVALTPAGLADYANAKWAETIARGTVTVGGFQSGTSEGDQGFVSRTIQLMQLGNIPAVNWNGNANTPITLAQLIALGLGMGQFVQIAFNVNGAALAAITAGTITTTVQIDALAWPTSS